MITLFPETITVQDVLSLTRYLSEEDQRWLVELLSRLEDAPLPEQATVDQAIALYLADACSLGRAAELAGVTRWELSAQLKQRNIPIFVHHSRTAPEIDDLAQELAREGVL